MTPPPLCLLLLASTDEMDNEQRGTFPPLPLPGDLTNKLVSFSFCLFSQTVQMESGLQHVRSLLGSSDESGISDKEVKDSLWYYFFDADKTVEWLLAEKDKNAKKGKKNGKFSFSFSFRLVRSLPWPVGDERGEWGRCQETREKFVELLRSTPLRVRPPPLAPRRPTELGEVDTLRKC